MRSVMARNEIPTMAGSTVRVCSFGGADTPE
jgi:hypothetical protein